MWAPALDAVVERRLLMNYRADPDVVARLVPTPFRPLLRHGQAVVGICLLRLGSARPAGWPGAFGLRSENAAHRVAVEWDTPEGTRSGVYIPRRDSASRLNVVLGGRVFPGVHHRAAFDVVEDRDRLHVGYRALDGSTSVEVNVRVTDELRGSALFADLGEASAFFEGGSAGYSASREPTKHDGLQLATSRWHLDPCQIESTTSSYFDDLTVFPAGSIQSDSALVMRQVPVRWTALAPVRGAPAPASI